MSASERFWLTHPAPREVIEALRKGIVLDIGCGPLKQTGTVGVDQRALPGVDVVCDCRRYFWNVCEEMTVILEAVRP